jgi:hypothetical protein
MPSDANHSAIVDTSVSLVDGPTSTRYLRKNTKQSVPPFSSAKMMPPVFAQKDVSDKKDGVLPHTTFGKSGHLAPQMSFKFLACFRGQSAVISSVQSNSLASMP